jgi:8-oxo-dGTP pyrophosphatase MutT (NUDIX family)
VKIKNSFVSGIELKTSVECIIHLLTISKGCKGLNWVRRPIFNHIMNKKNRILIKAAGGLVINENKDILFMFRLDKWDLPKGKLDPGESLETCAQREVKEETGISHLELIRFLTVTEHEYKERGKLILKETHWWLMKTRGDQKLIPQKEEDITELKWIGPSDFNKVQQNTYPGILEVMRAGGYST